MNYTGSFDLTETSKLLRETLLREAGCDQETLNTIFRAAESEFTMIVGVSPEEIERIAGRIAEWESRFAAA